MELQRYLDILKRRAAVIAIVIALATAVVTAAGVFALPVYTAKATLRIIFDVGLTDLVGRDDANSRLMKTYEYVLETSPILEKAIARLEPRASGLTVEALRKQLNIELVTGTELLSIAVTNGDAALARDLANTLADVLVEYVDNLYVGSNQKSASQVIEDQLITLEDRLADYRRQLASLSAVNPSSAEAEAIRQQIGVEEDTYRRLLYNYELVRLNESLRANNITVVDPATLPRRPSNGVGLMEIAITVVTGLIGGVGLALVMENLDSRIHSPDQLERLAQVPILSVLPRGMLSVDTYGQIDRRNGADKTVAEAYRLLSLNLQRLKHESPLKTILITSTASDEGKSTVAVNLAQTLAERGKITFLVESDMRRPVIGKTLSIDEDQIGLSTLLGNLSELDQVLRPTKQATLFAVCGGPKPSNPTSLLASPQMEHTLGYLSQQAQVTLIDAPPVLGLADVSVLAPQVDGVILVVTQSVSDRKSVSQALKQLQVAGARILGFVFLQKNHKSWNYE
jgi:capsular exopolysaccharide synthesis family protein